MSNTLSQILEMEYGLTTTFVFCGYSKSLDLKALSKNLGITLRPERNVLPVARREVEHRTVTVN